MRFKLDEHIPETAAALLRKAGHDADTVAEEDLSGTDDPVLFQTCVTESRTLVTLDTGFADLRLYEPGSHSGIVVLRLDNQSVAQILHAVRQVIQLLESEPLEGALWVVEESRIRIRTRRP